MNHVCELCGCPSERRVCQMCEDDLVRRGTGWEWIALVAWVLAVTVVAVALW